MHHVKLKFFGHRLLDLFYTQRFLLAVCTAWRRLFFGGCASPASALRSSAVSFLGGYMGG